MKLRHVIIIAVFILINVGVIMSLNFGDGEKKQDDTTELFVPVLSAKEVVLETEQFKVEGFGTIKAFKEVDISCEVQGKMVHSKSLKPGVSFRSGETIFQIDDTEVTFNIKSRKSAYINVLAQMLPDFKIDFNKEYNKWVGFINDIDLDKPLPDLPKWNSSKEKIFLSSRNIMTEYYSIKSLESQLRKYHVVAPFSGIITEIYVTEQSVVNPGTRILKFSQTGNYEVPVAIPAANIQDIKEGTESKIYTTSGKLKGMGVVSRISEVINRNTQSVDVFVKVKAIEGEEFISGEYVKVAIDQIGEFKGVRLPRAAIQEGEVFVFTASDSTLSKKKVSVLDENEHGVFVSGLNSKEIVITQEVVNYSDTTKYGVLIR